MGQGSKSKPKTPYQHLLEDIVASWRRLRFPKKVSMWFYPEKELDKGWSLRDLYERTAAARELGFDVILEDKEDGLHVYYRKKSPAVPNEWK